MTRRYGIYFNEGNAIRPYYVYDKVNDKVVGTYSTWGKAKAKYPKANDYTFLNAIFFEEAI